MSASGGPGFDQWLDAKLQQHAAAHTGPSPLPAQAQYQAAYVKAGAHLPLLAKIAAVLSTKAAIGVAAAALVVGAAGASESVITGSLNPSDWGQQVVKQVNSCKTALAPGSHGIGQCVSSFASQHGKVVSAEHRATPTPGHGVHTPGPPAGKGNSTPHPTPQPHPHPTPSHNKNK
ncbi:MAG TPA: hypothetical protein VNU19_10650 [Candidatus Acidoferrum sp.]|jgi:hypothetical protein|nr:hypothetical protein [Candidatus Acidoferrum sp.]